jgi:hypothetical protein
MTDFLHAVPLDHTTFGMHDLESEAFGIVVLALGGHMPHQVRDQTPNGLELLFVF